MRNFRFFISIVLLTTACFADDSSVTLGWMGNRESDLLGYRIHYGHASRQYSKQIDVGLITEFTVQNLTAGINYYFAVTALDVWGNESEYSAEVSATPGGETAIPWRFTLESAFPNPAVLNQMTTFRYGIPEQQDVELAVYNTLGQRVKTLLTATLPPGYHQRTWDGRDDAGQFLAAGVYYVRLHSGKHMLVKPFTFIH